VTRIVWRWAEQDFGFRFRSGTGKARAEYYQARDPGSYYSVPVKHRKLTEERVKQLALSQSPTSPSVVAIPWRNYDRDWDRIITDDGILLNFAGCLDPEELHRREDEGVGRAMDLVNAYLERPDPIAVTISLIQRVHVELMGAIYPFAGAWRTVGMHKGEGAEKWPLPRGGIEPVVDVFARDVLSRTPFLSDSDDEVFAFLAELMGEFLAIHPFREGNGRTSFVLGNLVLMQNDLLSLNVYDRRQDEARYFAACEDARIHKEYGSLTTLIAEWQDAALAKWKALHGQ
jgi:cell filamentation protein